MTFLQCNVMRKQNIVQRMLQNISPKAIFMVGVIMPVHSMRHISGETLSGFGERGRASDGLVALADGHG